MEDACIVYGHWVNFLAIWYFLWRSGIFSGNLVHFSHFGILKHEKSGKPAFSVKLKRNLNGGVLTLVVWVELY
jgi:hypothetical protein